MPRTLAGRYLLGARLGRGGMGTVWRAEDRMLDREVAVKELSVGHLAEEDLLIVQSRMKQEARAAARIKHPGVITIHDVVEQDGKPWIVMELIDGRSLAELVEQEGTLSPREAAGIGAQVLAALYRGHQAGVIHRDVKPANVLLERSTGRVVLTDFGIATFEGDSALTRTGDLIGSPDYLAPERVHGSRPGPESDLWGLGATLYAAVEGQSPFRRDSPLTTLAAVVTDPLPEPRNAGALAPVLHALMSKDPAERPSAPEAIRMLENVAAGHTTALSAPQGPSPLYSPTAGVPLADRSGLSEHTHAPTAKSEPIRPTFVEAEYRPTAAQGRQPAPQHTGTQHTAPLQDGPPYGGTQHGGPHHGGTQHQAAGHGRRGRRVWPTLLAAGLVAALIGGGAAYELTRHNHTSGSAGGQVSPPPSPTGSAPSTGAPSSAVPSPSLADGYSWQQDPAGFTFPLPPESGGVPWTAYQRDGRLAIKYSPDNGMHQVIFGVTPNQGVTPLQHAQAMEKDLLTNDKTYQRVSMDRNTFQKQYPGAVWEYTFTNADGVPHHAIEQLFDENGTEYDILVDYPVADWHTGLLRFQDITVGFSADG
ncbi:MULTISPECIES: serine/threonine-protein kinase [Streptacidiphilus]|uniref:non-specific serine/threonine protein kinase n=2 Tax=Streptacidiphilus TaxID=228398 RepID=A0ABV6UGL6_9ACTN|nr:serine/threonine-protein kinase [Streptacidiphilus jeojiense]